MKVAFNRFMEVLPWFSKCRWRNSEELYFFQIFACTFGILSLELALIRWTSGQIRIFAYFSNVVLMAAFLGMGLGVTLGRKYPGLVHYLLPLVLILSVPLTFSKEFNIMFMPFPDSLISLWGGDVLFGGALEYIRTLTIFILLFVLIVSVFLCAGAPVGYLFDKMKPLKAYSADLLGSVAGIVVFTVCSFFNANPVVWLALSCISFLFLSRKTISFLVYILIIMLAWVSIDGAVYSPYNRIDIRKTQTSLRLDVNRDFHQFMHDFSKNGFSRKDLKKESIEELKLLRDFYDLPFIINPSHKSALIVGAGTGNDVQAAIRNSYQSIYSVDIDPVIIRLGKIYHPERPYDNPNVIPIADDARAFFEKYSGNSFDVVCYGLLDSHAMFSSMSTLRLDNYVYTEEGIRSAWKHVAPGGHLTISFSVFAGPWIFERLYWTIAKATGQEPLAIWIGQHYAAMFLVAKDKNRIFLEPLKKFVRLLPSNNIDNVRTTSDDWPFLYLKPKHFPTGYLTVLFLILIIAVGSTILVYGRRSFTQNFDPTLFFMGMAFLLLETRGVTALSLLFGSTWLVNSSIFFGILITVLLVNLLVSYFKVHSLSKWFIFLCCSILLLLIVNNASLNQLPLLEKGLLGGLLNALPVAFAGVIVSSLLMTSRSVSASLGSNLLGSAIGGCLEYSSMYLGLKNILIIVLTLYVIAFYFHKIGLNYARQTIEI